MPSLSRARFDRRAAVWAGLIAGVVFLVVEMMLVATVGGGSLWGPPRMMAAIVMGEQVLPPPATFAMDVVVVAMLVHFVLSVVYGLILGGLVFRWGMGMALVAGLVFGLVLYVMNFYGFTAVFPWFAMARNWITILAHVVFGVVLAGAYRRLAKPAGAD